VVDVHRNPNAGALLHRDITRLCEYFARQGVERDADAIFGHLWRRYLRRNPEEVLADLSRAPGWNYGSGLYLIPLRQGFACANTTTDTLQGGGEHPPGRSEGGYAVRLTRLPAHTTRKSARRRRRRADRSTVTAAVSRWAGRAPYPRRCWRTGYPPATARRASGTGGRAAAPRPACASPLARSSSRQAGSPARRARRRAALRPRPTHPRRSPRQAAAQA